MNVLYTAHATASGGGRDGKSATTDGTVAVNLSIPKELGGPGGAGTNPEQLFAVGYSACFLGALRFVSGQAGFKLPAETTVSGDVGIGKRDDGGGFGLDVTLTISAPGADRAKVEELVQKAHIVCPYSNAIHKTVDVKLTVA